MKNYMKKIIVGFTAFMLLFLGANSAFAASWNSDPDDCQVGLSVANATTGVGVNNGQYGCGTLTTVSATAGQTISITIYYDNTSGVSQNNVRTIINQLNSGASTNHSFSGSIQSNPAGNFPLNNVNVSLSSSETLTFSSVKWFPNNQNTSAYPLLNGQSGSEVVNGGGLNIGTIVPTLPSSSTLVGQGSVIANFTVGNNGNGGGGGNNCTISDFTINGSSSTTIRSGNSANLYWNTYGCTSVNVYGPNGFNSSSLNDNRPVYPTNSGTYTINAYGNNGGNVSRTVYVTVDNYDNNNYCVINTFTVNGTSYANISSGSSANLVWNTSGCNSVTVSGPGISSNAFYGAQQMYPTSTSQYTITAYGNNGNAPSRTVSVGVTSNPIIVSNTCAVTLIATNVGQTSATLNGVLTNSTGPSYFQYGTSVNNLTSQTTVRTLANGTFSEVISGLTPNTSYYFRPVSNCNGGLSYGLIDTFTTLGTGTVRQVIVQGNTVVGTASPIMLKIENRYQAIAVGDMIDYTVTYKNIGKTKLTNPVLQVIIPRGIVLVNASRGTYALDTNTLTVPLEDLLPQAEGVVYLQGRVESILSNTAQVVTTAILVYTSPSGAQENAIAYVLNNPREFAPSTLGASAFFSGFGSIGLIGWLLILILILLVILLTRRFYGNKSVVHTTGPNGAHTTTTHY